MPLKRTLQHPSESRLHPLVVAIPARDEQDHIGACLTALAEQAGLQPDHIVLLVNNTTDRTVAVARQVDLPPATTLHIHECHLPPHLANAGQARRQAMQIAAGLAGADGVLLTTDADGQVDSDWLACNVAALRDGAGAVAGWVDLHPREWSLIPMALHEDDARECAYDALCDEIHARLDPDPADPMPRHTQNSGASIAVTAAAFHLVGGIPPVASGEDRAFLAALRRKDVWIRHSPACHVTVSGRINGRAIGGMADTIRRRMKQPDLYLDDRLEPAAHCARRAALRRRLRMFLEDPESDINFPALTGLDRDIVSQLGKQRYFGVAWDILEHSSPNLARSRVTVEQLPSQMRIAEQICAELRKSDADYRLALTSKWAAPVD